MKCILLLSGAFCALTMVSCDDQGRAIRHDTPTETPRAGSKPMPLPGDATEEHWSGPTSGKDERSVPDPITGTPNQTPNR